MSAARFGTDRREVCVWLFNRVRVGIGWKPQDLWVGAFWKHTLDVVPSERNTQVWICVLPCVPIHLVIQRPLAPARAGASS